MREKSKPSLAREKFAEEERSRGIPHRQKTCDPARRLLVGDHLRTRSSIIGRVYELISFTEAELRTRRAGLGIHSFFHPGSWIFL